MRPLNQIALETPHGLKLLELYQGDITELPFPVDLLVISAFPGDYYPTPGTVIASIRERLGIDVRQLRNECAFDFVEALGIWISRKLGGPVGRVVCVEVIGQGLRLGELLDNVFVGVAVLEAKGQAPRAIALPLLGTGDQALAAAEVIATILPAARRVLESSPGLDRIVFVERNQHKAVQLDVALNQILGRSHVTLPKRPLNQSLRAEMLSLMSQTDFLVSPSHRALVDEIRRILEVETARSFEIGILGRRVVEFVVDDLLGKKHTSPDLLKKIDALADAGVASWIRGYMHVLRTLGNEAAHEKDQTGKRPPFASENDLTIALFCVQRVWSFWSEWKLETKT